MNSKLFFHTIEYAKLFKILPLLHMYSRVNEYTIQNLIFVTYAQKGHRIWY